MFFSCLQLLLCFLVTISGLFAGGATHQAIIPSLTGGTFALVSNPNNPGTFTIVQHNAGVPSATPLQQLPGYMATSMGPLSQQRLIQQQVSRLSICDCKLCLLRNIHENTCSFEIFILEVTKVIQI